MEKREQEGYPRENLQMPGMTLRDWFAGQVIGPAMGSEETCANIEEVAKEEKVTFSEMAARYSYRLADAMMEERGRK